MVIATRAENLGSDAIAALLRAMLEIGEATRNGSLASIRTHRAWADSSQTSRTNPTVSRPAHLHDLQSGLAPHSAGLAG
ncbi:MAG: hypothetical protein LC721_11360 [Actinobacteria bacterium]|nr:hypothetical protein [Actinomycetota bacterium]